MCRSRKKSISFLCSYSLMLVLCHLMWNKLLLAHRENTTFSLACREWVSQKALHPSATKPRENHLDTRNDLKENGKMSVVQNSAHFHCLLYSFQIQTYYLIFGEPERLTCPCHCFKNPANCIYFSARKDSIPLFWKDNDNNFVNFLDIPCLRHSFTFYIGSEVGLMTFSSHNDGGCQPPYGDRGIWVLPKAQSKLVVEEYGGMRCSWCPVSVGVCRCGDSWFPGVGDMYCILFSFFLPELGLNARVFLVWNQVFINSYLHHSEFYSSSS